ncbi:MAG: DUF4864 domain-containing protein [Ramlibacter sp.]|nr:DUF4864 domain-containing protein [Ramlibacter sp.]
MARLLQRFALVLWLVTGSLCATAAPPAMAPLPAADVKAVRATVQGQLDAFAARDAEKAFSYAAPSMRERLGSAERFMAMVRAGYPVVYEPAHVAFLIPEALPDGTVVQRVQMTDQRGDAWLATYTLQRQKDKAWRITGCEVQGNKGRVA